MDWPDLTHDEFSDLVFLPCRREPSSPTGYGFAVYGADGRHREAFDHRWCAVLPAQEAELALPGTAIYGGMLMDHFGHFLLEAMSRLWFIRAHPELPVIWHWIALPVPHAPWQGWMNQAWDLLGLRSRRHHMVRRPAHCSRVILPQSGLIADDAMHPAQARALARVDGSAASASGRVWLSRRSLPSQFGGIDGEGEVERALSARGWRIVEPQSLPVREQAGLFADAAVVAGFAGSAFHAAALCAAPRTRLVILRRPLVNEGPYRAIAEARGISQTFLTVGLAPLGPLNAWTRFRLERADEATQRVLEAAQPAVAGGSTGPCRPAG